MNQIYKSISDEVLLFIRMWAAAITEQNRWRIRRNRWTLALAG